MTTSLEVRERHREEVKRYRLRHPERVAATKERWSKRNWDKVLGYYRAGMRKYMLTEKGKEARRNAKRRANFKRRHREQISFYLNPPFKGAQLHHVDERIGIWIPPALHSSINHNLNTGKGMVEINEAVAHWLLGYTD